MVIRKHKKKNFLSAFKAMLYRIISRLSKLNKKTQWVVAASALLLFAAILVVIFIPKGAVTVADAEKINPATAQGTGSQSVAGEQQSHTPSTSSSPSPSPSVSPSPSPTPDPTLKKGDKSKRVQELQERLMELDYMDIDESTQLFGPATKLAVQYFQRQHGIQQDGVAGAKTQELIFSKQAKKYTLLEGTKGTDVDSLQRQLISLGYLGKATGYYGSETEDAVKAFQKRNKLDVDGKTGHDTLDLIYSPNAKMSASKAETAQRRASVSKMISVAQKQLGKPYIRGNEGPRSFDCSGLVYYCLKQAGSSRNRYNAAGYSKVSDWKEIKSMGQLQKGDLLFFWNKAKSKVGHVGIYIGGGMMIDASSSNGKVVKRSCTTRYWKRMFVRARRPW
jgi:cell wall-associated NlpC family hydrolase